MTVEELLAQATARITSLETDLQNCRNDLAQRDQTVTQLQSQIAERDTSITTLRSDATARDGLLQEAEGRITGLSSDLATARQTIQSLTQELDTAKAKLANPSREAAAICASLSTTPLSVPAPAVEAAATENQDPIAQYNQLIRAGKAKEAAEFYEKHIRPLFHK